MSRSSARRAQVEPLTALVALVVVCAGLSLYAGVLDDVSVRTADDAEAPTAGVVTDRVRAHLAPAGVAVPERLDGVTTVDSAADRLNASLTCSDEQWSSGPTTPSTARRATEPVSVRVAPGRIDPCRLTVAVWS